MPAPLFGTPNVGDVSLTRSPVFSGGSYVASLPLSNVQDRRTQLIARTTDASTGSTTFDVDLGVASVIGILAVLVRNLTQSSVPTIRWLGAPSTAFASGYDSGTVQAWPNTANAELLTGPDGTQTYVWSKVIPATPQTYRYWRCQITDTANVDGHLDIARVWMSGAYQPILINVGWQTGYESESTRTVTDGGAAIYRAKPGRRTDKFTLDKQLEADTFAQVRAIQRRLGTTGQIFFVASPGDAYEWEQSYLGVLREMTSLEYTGAGYMQAGYSIVEDL